MLRLVVRNDGVGPALRVRLEVQVCGIDGEPSPTGQALPCDITEALSIAAGADHTLRVSLPSLVADWEPGSGTPSFPYLCDIELTYQDVLGNQFRVTGRLDPNTSKFRHLQLEQLDDGGRPASALQLVQPDSPA